MELMRFVPRQITMSLLPGLTVTAAPAPDLRRDLPPDMRLYDYREVATALGVNEQSVRRLVRAGALRSVDVSPSGRSDPRVPESELRRFIADRGAPPAPPSAAGPDPAKPKRRLIIKAEHL